MAEDSAVAPVFTGPAAARGPRGRWIAELGLVGVAAAWGLTFTVIQDAVVVLAPLAFVAYRFLVAGLLMAAPFAAGLRRLSGQGWLAGVVLGLLLVSGYVTQTIGLTHTTASSAGFITGLYVVFTPLLGWVLLRQALRPWAWACVAAATVGLLLLSGFGGGWHPLGDGLMLVCSVSFALHILYTDRVVRRFEVGPLVAVSLTVCGLVALVLAALTGDLSVPSGGQVWVALLFTAVFASSLAYFMQSFAQLRTSPARTSLILATEPVFAGVFGFWLAGDRLSTLGWVGAGVMALAIIAMEAKPPRPASPT
ncbi:DMT family transporter [Amycolatopsis nigrescens]|uniref:DMT family transporter n=1 Tax=Amycolatopsis nigrescens TaxID=381445 RepID=UPI0003632E32|nr:DMT family transporter [Amycolatopsis nigrescens]